MRVLFAAGGTAGHVNPALAIAQGIAVRWPGADIHFAGRQAGMERGLVQKAGYPFHPIEVRGFQRKPTPQNAVRNLQALWHLAFAPGAAQKILKAVQPDVVIGAGGYVSGPVLREAARRGYKTAIHEQNAWPGMTNRLLAKDVDVIFAPTASAVERLGYHAKTIVTGNPVRPEVTMQDRTAARRALGAGERPVLLSYGGSLGAMRLNQVVADLAEWHLAHRDFLHIHATGSIEKEDFAALAKEKGIAGRKNFVIREYIDDMPAMLAAADLVICRAGALTLAELAAVGRAAVLVPSPNVAENHQHHNAMEFAKVGAAKVLEESTLTGQLLIDTVDALTADPAVLQQMGQAAHRLDHPDALEKIIDAVARLVIG
ncbi:MAG: UDP-N-acetylglucosamine--N-acetylmuramyl-(pentapeptide) pyrophosphoryl-undecaprenol N-acetylglucosamine transferase [Ruminococcaceae bacterium]|nr:UDP-N-acetylglucosamine--N-acetylmuramyl-(pentapeptide) pyrophosphoryl-undecaprenol N-acetylglucosamine transferase [Oscillospiraceae bacterium]